MESNKITFTRRELYDLVWASSMVSLSKKYAISDNGLRKICKRMNIPLPTNGHWVKLQFGKKVKIKSLVVDDTVEQTVKLELRKEGEEPTNNPVKKLAKEIKVVVTDQQGSPDPLIVKARQRLKGKEARAYNHVGMVECKGDELDIRVALCNVDRALRFMDVLIKALRARNHAIHFRNGETYAIVKGDDIKIRFHELGKRVVVNDRNWNRTELHPTGILSFKAGNFTPKEWKDSAKDPARRLENFLPDIIAWLELEADYWNEIREGHRREREVEERLRQTEKDLKERKRLELVAFEGLLGLSERWDKAKKLREYIDEVERRGGMGGGLGDRSSRTHNESRLGDGATPGDIANDPKTPKDLQKWLDWARKKADWYDPFLGREDEFLGVFE